MSIPKGFREVSTGFAPLEHAIKQYCVYNSRHGIAIPSGYHPPPVWRAALFCVTFDPHSPSRLRPRLKLDLFMHRLSLYMCRNQVCHDETVGDRLNIRGRDKSGHEGRTGQDRPERDHTSSPGEDEHRCGGGGGDGDHGSEKLSGKTHLQETGCGTPRASAGGWFAVEGQKEEGGKTEVRGIDCSSDSSGGNGRCRLKAERMRAGNGVDGGERGGGNSGGGGGGCDGGDRGYCGALPPNERQKQCLSLMLAYERGKTSDLVQCVIVRDVSGTLQARSRNFVIVLESSQIFQRAATSVRGL